MPYITGIRELGIKDNEEERIMEQVVEKQLGGTIEAQMSIEKKLDWLQKIYAMVKQVWRDDRILCESRRMEVEEEQEDIIANGTICLEEEIDVDTAKKQLD